MNKIESTSIRHSAGLKQRFHDQILVKLVDWVLGQKVDQGIISYMSWNKQEQALIYKLIDNPKAADINAGAIDLRFIRLFRSAAKNGLNTADIKMFYRYRDRLPIKQLNWAYDLADFDLANGKLLSKQPIHAGFYMLEIQTDLPKYQSRLPFEISFRGTNKETDQNEICWFCATSGTIGKRLLWLDHDSTLQISSREVRATQHMSYLRLSRLTRSFFISRLFKKSGRPFVLAKHKAISESVLQKLWSDYDLLFVEKTDLQQAYSHHVSHIEAAKIPTPKQQIFNLSRWLK